MNAETLYAGLAALLISAGTVRLLLARDHVARLIAMNIVGLGSLLLLLLLAARSGHIDPVLSALVITGLVITLAFTGVGAVLVRRLEGTPLRDVSADRTDRSEPGAGAAQTDEEVPGP